MEGTEALAGENVAELEAHWLEQMRELTDTGLSEEEAFWLAPRRLGNAGPLNQEFSKVECEDLYLRDLQIKIPYRTEIKGDNLI